MTTAETNPVGYLQEMCQKYYLQIPEYQEVNSSGPDHCREFTFKCLFERYETSGLSRQKKQAKSEAAKAMVELLKQEGYFEKIFKKAEASNNINHTTEHGIVTPVKNPISALNEFCQKNGYPQPTFFETSGICGIFTCECKVEDKKTYGSGSNKKIAKTEAAFKMCCDLNIICNSVDDIMRDSENNFSSEKNPVSALQELCTKNPSLKTLEYTELPPTMNLFVIRCKLDEISCEGRGTTKKSAKAQAANNVLAKLSTQGLTNGHQKIDQKKIATVVSASRVLNARGASASGSHELQDFNIDSTDEEDNANDDKNPSQETVTNLQVKLGVLSLDPEREHEDAADRKSQNTTSQAHEEPVESSNVN